MKKIQDYFNENPKMARTAGYDDVYQEVIGLLPPGKRHLKVLDVGCGIGNFMYLLKTANYTNVTGIDFAEMPLQIAKERAPDYIYRLHDLTNPLPYEDDSFDIAVCLDVIPYTKNPFQILEEVIRVSKQSIITVRNGVWSEILTIFRPNLIYKSGPNFMHATEMILKNAIHYLGGEG